MSFQWYGRYGLHLVDRFNMKRLDINVLQKNMPKQTQVHPKQIQIVVYKVADALNSDEFPSTERNK